MRAAARHYNVDGRTVAAVVERLRERDDDGTPVVVEFTPRCIRVNLDALDKVLQVPSGRWDQHGGRVKRGA